MKDSEVRLLAEAKSADKWTNRARFVVFNQCGDRPRVFGGIIGMYALYATIVIPEFLTGVNISRIES